MKPIVFIITLLLPANVSAFCFKEAGIEYGISPLLLRSIAQHESGMNPAAFCRNANGTYDYGLMQINSRWAKVLGTEHWMRLGDPCTNIRTGAWILAQCVRRHGYTWRAVGCYHSNTLGRRERYAGRIAALMTRQARWAEGPIRGPTVSAQPPGLPSDSWDDVSGKPL
ncbi:MAG TPA: lytic transglycosylase domain-containing protein [Geobacteraceae bacterium]|nr:lytic transglycosylase domain-containing protein [Geobacteraceae bacterium]